MSTARGGTHGPGESAPHAPGTSDSNLEHLIRALTASGHPYERTGRDAALAAFRAQGAQRGRAHRGSGRAGRSWRILVPVRAAAIAGAGIAMLGALTAAAYAQALPASFQRIAHSVLAPLGVPGTAQRSADETPSPRATLASGQAYPSADGAEGAKSSAAVATPTSSTTAGHPAAGPRASPAADSPLPPTALSVQLQVTSGLVTDRFTVTVPAHSGNPGETVLLTELVNGTWQAVASRSLGAATRITFPVSASSASGQVFRAELAYPGMAIPTDSNSVSVPSATSHPGK